MCWYAFATRNGHDLELMDGGRKYVLANLDLNVAFCRAVFYAKQDTGSCDAMLRLGALGADLCSDAIQECTGLARDKRKLSPDEVVAAFEQWQSHRPHYEPEASAYWFLKTCVANGLGVRFS